MIYHGRVAEDGRIDFENQPPLAKGTKVRIEPVSEGSANGAPEQRGCDTRTVWEKLDNLAGRAVGLPEDLSERHDHYRRLRQ